MHCLKTTTQYEITTASLISYCKEFIIIQFLNTHPSKLHFQNLFPSHILCLNETKIQNVQTHEEIYNVF
jgi:hypothetical protein